MAFFFDKIDRKKGRKIFLSTLELPKKEIKILSSYAFIDDIIKDPDLFLENLKVFEPQLIGVSQSTIEKLKKYAVDRFKKKKEIEEVKPAGLRMEYVGPTIEGWKKFIVYEGSKELGSAHIDEIKFIKDGKWVTEGVNLSYIQASEKHKGYGTKIVQVMIDYVRRKGLKYVTLAAFEPESTAIAEKLGFVEYGIVREGEHKGKPRYRLDLQ